MDRKNLLSELLNSIEKKENKEFRYIGTGNPDADILIIGKETSVHDNEDQYNRETLNNYSDWQELVKNYQSIDKTILNSHSYSPFYPYKGQLFKIDNGNNRGTSRTWYNYQKLINLICKKNENKDIDFHEHIYDIDELDPDEYHDEQIIDWLKENSNLEFDLSASIPFIHTFPCLNRCTKLKYIFNQFFPGNRIFFDLFKCTITFPLLVCRHCKGKRSAFAFIAEYPQLAPLFGNKFGHNF